VKRDGHPIEIGRRRFLGGLAVGGAAIAGACGRGRPRLNVYNWSDYVAPHTVSNFERESGVEVRYGTYESDQEMLAKVMGGNSGWDVVFPSAEYIAPMRDLELLATLDHTRLPNLTALETSFRNPPWDPELRWNVPYMHGSTGIVYQNAVSPRPTSWANLWDPRLGGKLTMLDDAPEVIGACLKRRGRSINSSDPSELRDAQADAVAQKPLVRAYLNAEVRDQLVAGDVSVAQAWAVTAAQAIAAAPDKLAFAFPTEGFPRFCDNVAILRESGRSDLAHQFINYLLRPDVAAAIVVTTHTATANGEALKLLPPEIRDNPVLFPSAEILSRGEWFVAQSSTSQRLRDRLWTEIKGS